MDTYEVISDFLDNEPFELEELARALADAEGREVLLDAIAVRRALRDEVPAAPVVLPVDKVARRRWIATGFLAASIVFGAGAAWLLPPLLRQQRAALSDVPPQPDRVVTVQVPASSGD